MEIVSEIVGKFTNGDVEFDVSQITLRNTLGVEIKCISYGATMISVVAPDRHGILESIVLCASYDELVSPTSKKPKYVGTIGRVCNRIANGTFVMNNNSYNLAINNGPNHLHGGLRGFDKNIWNFTLVEEPERVGVKFTYISVDGEESYPGNLKVSAEYYLTSTNEIHMIFDAKTDKNTPINMTNHAFWNLSGNFCRSIKEHSLQLACSHYLPVNSTLIPTGEIAHVNGTPFDFTNPKQLGDAIENINHVGSNGIGNFTGIDHCFVNDNTDTTENRYVATLTDDISGRQLIVYSNQTSVQIYTGNFLSKDPNDAPFVVHNAMCIENQNFPNSPNQPNFPSIILNPGEKYHHSAVYCLRNVEMNS